MFKVPWKKMTKDIFVAVYDDIEVELVFDNRYGKFILYSKLEPLELFNCQCLAKAKELARRYLKYLSQPTQHKIGDLVTFITNSPHRLEITMHYITGIEGDKCRIDMGPFGIPLVNAYLCEKSHL